MSIVVAGLGPATRDAVARVAASCRQDVRWCHTGAEAVELVTEHQPIVVISQVELPDISGIQLCRLLEEEDAAPFTSFVLVAPAEDSRVRFLVESACPGASVVEPSFEAIASEIEKAVRLARVDARTEISSRTVLQRLSRTSDRALLEAVVAAEVRSMGEAGTRERLSARIAELLRRLFAPAWTALLIDRSPSEILLTAPEASRATAEQRAREALGVGSDAPCRWQEPVVEDPEPKPSPEPATLVVEAPVFVGGKHFAQLAAAFPVSGRTRDERRIVDLVASELGGPLQIIVLLEEMQSAATTDPLTGLLNRRGMVDLMVRESSRAQRYGHPTSALLLDVDHFKRVNDVHGHAAGDRVLRALAATLRAHTRASDLVARWGGEELLVILPQTGPEAALVLADRLREEVAGRSIDIGEGVCLHVTVSIGVAGGSPPVAFEPLVEEADRALYEAKRSGRNQVCRSTVSSAA